MGVDKNPYRVKRGGGLRVASNPVQHGVPRYLDTESLPSTQVYPEICYGTDPHVPIRTDIHGCANVYMYLGDYQSPSSKAAAIAAAKATTWWPAWLKETLTSPGDF